MGQRQLREEQAASQQSLFGVPPSGGLGELPPDGGTPNRFLVSKSGVVRANGNFHELKCAEEWYAGFDFSSRQPVLPRTQA
jgi:hypothetical protein